MLRQSKVAVLNSQEPLKGETLKVSMPSPLMMLLKLTRSGRRGGAAASDKENGKVLAPIRTVLDPKPQGGLRPTPPPLPYRLTFKSRRSKKNVWSRHKTVTYDLGFRATTVKVKIQAFESRLRRVFINGEEVTRCVANEPEWTFSYFYTDRTDAEIGENRQGVVLKVIVRNDLSVSLFADGFPVEKLRRSSAFIKGSPPPPPLEEDMETLDRREVAQLVHI
jgi:hypothetical protein